MTLITDRFENLDFALNILTVVSLPFNENSYVIWRRDSNESIIIDPGFEPQDIFDAIKISKTTPIAIVLTHGHADHIGGNSAVREKWPTIPIIIGEHEADKLLDPWKNLSAQFGLELISPAADQLVKHGEVMPLAGINWRVAHVPGHSSGHVVYIAEQFSPPVVIGGDVLFAGSIGRTDFPDGDHETLLQGIADHLLTLPDETIVFSGHGEPTTIGTERRTNPFLTE